MVRVWILAAAIGGIATGAGGSIAAEARWWRPAMPEIRIDVQEAGVPTPTLVLVYGGAGSDPFRPDGLAGDRIGSCRTLGSVCAAPAGHHVIQFAGAGRQSIQVRWLNADGQPEIGGVVWQGIAHPSQVTLRCDLSVSDPRKACSLVRVQG